ncbi:MULTISPECIES: TetR/AcrR family transcriptional regulator [unclassified Leucobacter]|uniref:TetR/AcrR family transcriptional regulator n=1 Tax=unclassified Leucobacter TaxID=2621730 RepID=UPI00165E2AE9|nr:MULTISPECIES: TetR/AcrR family transcriptional regulator [unclassified Leucobacter]MBC9928219.1 TetR/AcrR family transcriptional regulator [Leucobacter sp. cx-169]
MAEPAPTRRTSPTKRAILDAALELASARGITGTSMDDVAQLAGVAKGSLYYNFSSKDRLFEVLLEEGIVAVAARLSERSAGLSGQEALRALVAGVITLTQENTEFAKLMAAELFRMDRSWQQSFAALRHEVLGLFATALDAAAVENGAGSASTPRPARLIGAAGVFGASLLAGLEWLVFEPDLPRETVVEAVLAQLSLSGER